jgi:hypothetical protein
VEAISKYFTLPLYFIPQFAHEGFGTVSLDGSTFMFGCYNVPVDGTSPGYATTGNPGRVIARVYATGQVDTSILMIDAYQYPNTINSVVSIDGSTGFWVREHGVQLIRNVLLLCTCNADVWQAVPKQQPSVTLARRRWLKRRHPLSSLRFCQHNHAALHCVHV